MSTGTGSSYGVNINHLASFVRATCDADVIRSTNEYEHGELESVLCAPEEKTLPTANPSVSSLEHCDRLKDVAGRHQIGHPIPRQSFLSQYGLATKVLLTFSGVIASAIVFLLV